LTRGYKLTEPEKLLRRMSEQELVDKTLELAGMAGWWWHHTRPAWDGGRFKTPLGGMRGFPDYVFARTTGREILEAHITDTVLTARGFQIEAEATKMRWLGQLLIVEFKTELGGYGPGQEEWARRLEPTGAYRLWRPSSWPEIEKELVRR
jgi:hypothetical protein